MVYEDLYQKSIENPEKFWQEQALRIKWFKHPNTIIGQDENGIKRWFIDGELNTSYLALDYHIGAGRGEQIALIYDSPVTNTIKKFSYKELTVLVERCAAGMRSFGIMKGDRVVIYMPMVPEAVIAMLACARLGAIHSVVFGGFAANELAVRIDDARPKLVISASCGIEVDRIVPYKPLLDRAIELSKHQPDICVVLQRPELQADLLPKRDIEWQELMLDRGPIEPVSLKATDPLYILYTSGTTGCPKGVVRDNGGHAVAMRYSMEFVYGMQAGDVFWAASDIGWVVGHSYIVYAPLIAGCTTILYEGKPVKTPNAGAFWRVCAEHGVKAIFTAPTVFRAIRKEDSDAQFFAKYDMHRLNYIFLAGERLDPSTYHWLHEKSGLPILDHWWQTETGWAMVANPVGVGMKSTKPGSATLPVPGFNIKILSSSGKELSKGEEGNIVVKLPLPPGCLPTIWRDHERFRDSYLNIFPGYYLTGDSGFIDEDGYIYIMGRTDDVINIAGHRLSTGRMEELIGSHPAVAESAVIGVYDDLKGQVPLAFIVLNDGVDDHSLQINTELVKLIREKIGPLACFKKTLVVNRLPKTRSGKILRKVLRLIVDGKEYGVPSTIEDSTVLEEIKEKIAYDWHGRC